MKKIPFILLAFVWTVANGQRPLRSSVPDGYIFVAAHRADWKYAPENSLQALRNAIFFGADIIETDVRQTRDGHFVMMYDATVDRMTNGTGLISEMSLEEIRRLRLKTNWGQSTQMSVATLDEYVEEAKGRVNLYLDKAGIDLPGAEEGATVRSLLQVLRRYDTLQETVFVLDWPYEKARRIFGAALDSVIYCPVIEDRIPNLTLRNTSNACTPLHSSFVCRRSKPRPIACCLVCWSQAVGLSWQPPGRITQQGTTTTYPFFNIRRRGGDGSLSVDLPFLRQIFQRILFNISDQNSDIDTISVQKN